MNPLLDNVQVLSNQYRFRKQFDKADGLSELPKLPLAYPLIIAFCTIIGLFQLGYVPIANLIMGNLDYGGLLAADGSVFRTASIVGSIFGSVHQFAIFLERRDKGDLVCIYKYLFIVVLIALAVLWLFGAYGNIRSGGSWDDSSYIYTYGRLNGLTGA